MKPCTSLWGKIFGHKLESYLVKIEPKLMPDPAFPFARDKFQKGYDETYATQCKRCGEISSVQVWPVADGGWWSKQERGNNDSNS